MLLWIQEASWLSSYCERAPSRREIVLAGPYSLVLIMTRLPGVFKGWLFALKARPGVARVACAQSVAFSYRPAATSDSLGVVASRNQNRVAELTVMATERSKSRWALIVNPLVDGEADDLFGPKLLRAEAVKRDMERCPNPGDAKPSRTVRNR